jgi:methanogenic corrinoid protein MtbC1
MSDAQNRQQKNSPVKSDRSVGSLASQALSVLVSRRIAKPGELSERFIVALSRAACSSDPSARDQVVREMLSARINRFEIADGYIPEVARRMGEAWCDDGMSFAEVTIGVARLQALLRDLTENWSVESRMYDDGLNIVVLMLADDFHTLGPMLVTSQLRRMGASVRLLLGRPLPEIKTTVREQSFDMVLVSVAHVAKLATTGELVKIIRNNMLTPAPIVVGGPAIDFDDDAKAVTGADHVSNDVKEALTLCGLMDRTKARAPTVAERE